MLKTIIINLLFLVFLIQSGYAQSGSELMDEILDYSKKFMKNAKATSGIELTYKQITIREPYTENDAEDLALKSTQHSVDSNLRFMPDSSISDDMKYEFLIRNYASELERLRQGIHQEFTHIISINGESINVKMIENDILMTEDTYEDTKRISKMLSSPENNKYHVTERPAIRES